MDFIKSQFATLKVYKNYKNCFVYYYLAHFSFLYFLKHSLRKCVEIMNSSCLGTGENHLFSEECTMGWVNRQTMISILENSFYTYKAHCGLGVCVCVCVREREGEREDDYETLRGD